MRVEGKNSRICLLPSEEEAAGAAYGRAFRDEIGLMISDFLRRSDVTAEVPLSFLISEAKAALPHIPAIILKEMRALADAADADFHEVLALNTLADVDGKYMQRLLHCCNFVVAARSGGTHTVLHGRNLDFPMPPEVNRAAALVLVRPPRDESRHAVAYLTWAGLLGGFTACSSAGICISEVTSPTSDCVTDALPLAMQIRLALEGAGDVTAVFDAMEGQRRSGGFNFAVSSASGALPVAIETTHSICARRRAVRGRLVVDNCCLCPAAARNRLTYSAGVFRHARTTMLLDAAGNGPGIDTIKAILRDDYDLAHGRRARRTYNTICNHHTALSAVLCPVEGRIHVSQFGMPAPLHDYDEIDLESLWRLCEEGDAAVNPVSGHGLVGGQDVYVG